MKWDIVINRDRPDCLVLDTKWKNIGKTIPSPDDLRQMFVYMQYFKAKKVSLIYPGEETRINSGLYYSVDYPNQNETSQDECSVISIGIEKNTIEWQKSIAEKLYTWCGSHVNV